MESLAKQVSSLNARAAHTANNQLTLLQDENKRMVAERTVLQTQVGGVWINWELVSSVGQTYFTFSHFSGQQGSSREGAVRGLFENYEGEGGGS